MTEGRHWPELERLIQWARFRRSGRFISCDKGSVDHCFGVTGRWQWVWQIHILRQNENERVLIRAIRLIRILR